MNLPWDLWKRLSRCIEERDTLAARVAELERDLEQAKADRARAAMDARNPLMAQLAELEARCKRLEEAGDAMAKAASPFVLTEIEEGFDGDPVPMDSVGEDYEITYDCPPTAGDHVAMDLARKAWREAKEAKP